ncbi:MAG: VWA domain-containing protein [Halanaeroarchaeum sp.]
MDATTLEAYPDTDDDGIQDDLEGFVACDDCAQLDENLNPDNERGLGKRSANADTILNFDAYQEGADAVPAPLVNLHDVKPGDFGELTLSMHLFDNPGYIWMQGELVSADENGVTEPESKDPQEQEGVVELLDEIQTLLWYDEDGDNVFSPGAAGGGEADIVLVLDRSGSMGGTKLTQAKAGAKLLVDTVGPDVRVGVVAFDDTEALIHELSTDKAAVKAAIDGINAGGTTNIEGGINGARDIILGSDVGAEVDPAVIADANTPNYVVLLSDGAPNVSDNDGGDTNDSPVEEAQALKDAGVTLFTIAYGVSSGSATDLLMQDVASDPAETYAYLAADIAEIQAIFAQIGQILAGEESLFRGTLRELLDAVGTDFGIHLDGIPATPFDELQGDPTAVEREAFVNSTTNAIGLAWWLPVDHANEIQTDSVTFDLGFYTEQARHNDGSGQPAEVTTTTQV